MRLDAHPSFRFAHNIVLQGDENRMFPNVRGFVLEYWRLSYTEKLNVLRSGVVEAGFKHVVEIPGFQGDRYRAILRVIWEASHEWGEFTHLLGFHGTENLYFRESRDAVFFKLSLP